MENNNNNYNYSTYPDSGNSSPRSREIDSENASWDELQPQSSIYKVRFMCSYGGKIHPRPHDNQLTYVGGETKILAVDRNIRFSAFIAKLSSLCEEEVCFKYQLPGEDLDALISVTNDEDLEHMMLEYDRLFRASAKPARMRLFLFPMLNSSITGSFASTDSKSERQWFVDALNSVQISNLEDSTPTAAAAASGATPDFLFGLDKGHALPHAIHAPQSAVAKVVDSAPEPTVPEVFQKEIRGGSECGSEDHHVLRDPVVSPSEIQRQMHDFQRFQIASHEQALLQRKTDELNARAYYGDYYAQQKAPEKILPPQQAVPVAVQSPYWQERQVTTGGYSGTMASGGEQVYLIPSSAGMYQPPAVRPVSGQAGQAYYGMQRMVPEMHREQPVYNVVPQQSIQQQQQHQHQQQQQQQRIGAYTTDASGRMTEHGYAQVSYDSAGRQVYYTAPPRGMVPTYQAVADVRQEGGGVLNQEGKVVVNASHTSSV
ncbi:hypothetical protein LguiB_017436 [Lonicera macranthoides]